MNRIGYRRGQESERLGFVARDIRTADLDAIPQKSAILHYLSFL
jgi:hypothetical protein